MPFRPVSLIGIECILLYMKVNKRFRTAQHCAAIRKAEKRVPLRINFLQLEDLDIIIDELKYHLDVHRKCDHLTNCNSLASYVLRNDLEIRNDLDQYCLPIPPTDLRLTPGDLIFNTQPHNFHNDRRNIIVARQTQLSTMKLNLQRHIKRSSQGIFHPLFTENYVSELKAKIKKLEENLEDFQLQREFARNPCNNLLQLTIFKYKNNSNRLVQQGVYNMKLEKAMKQLTKFLFSGRRHPIQVKRLKLSQNIKILRLPEDIKLNIKELDIEGDLDKFCEGIQPILSKDSFPLDIVSVSFNQREQFTPHEMIKKAKKVHMSCGLFTQIDHTIFSQLECLELDMLEEHFIAAEYFHIVQEWLNTQKRVGTRYSFRVHSECIKILDRMRFRFNGWLLDTGGVAIPMGADTAAKIHVSYQCSRLVLEVLAE